MHPSLLFPDLFYIDCIFNEPSTSDATVRDGPAVEIV